MEVLKSRESMGLSKGRYEEAIGVSNKRAD